MRLIIILAGLLISTGAGMWEHISLFDIFLSLVFLGAVFEVGSWGIESLPESSDGSLGLYFDCGGDDCSGFF